MGVSIHHRGKNLTKFDNMHICFKKPGKPGNKMMKHVFLSCDIAMFLVRPSSPTVHPSGIRVDDTTPPKDDRLKEAKL